MAKPFAISCWQDINNFFNRSQHYLDREFAMMEKPLGNWGDWIQYAGVFPTGTGGSSRVSLMGTRRPQATNKWSQMVGLQPDCAVSCEAPVTNIPANAWDNRWYNLFETSFRSPVYCLKSMWLDALNLPLQIENIERNLKEYLDEVLDDFYRCTFIAAAQNKWVGIDNNTSFIRTGLWNFEMDANGNPNYDRIVLDPTLLSQVGAISLLTQDVLDFISIYAYFTKAWNFMDSNLLPLMIDPFTSQKIPQQDNNRRLDNRVVDKEALDPRLGYQRNYAGWGHHMDMFQLRYDWDLTNPNYPNGVLQRQYHWTEQAVTSGVTDAPNPNFLSASFAIAVPFNPEVVKFQNFAPPKSVGKDAKFEAYTWAYDGVYKWINETNDITPSNETRSKGYWLGELNKAGKPHRYDLGHAILYRLYDSAGVLKSCRPLQVAVGNYYLADLACPPFDFAPPPLAVRTLCGSFTKAGCGCAPCIPPGDCIAAGDIVS